MLLNAKQLMKLPIHAPSNPATTRKNTGHTGEIWAKESSDTTTLSWL